MVKSKKKSHKNKKKWLYVALLIVLVGLIYRQTGIVLDKQRFQRAEASMESLFVEIEEIIGKADQVKRQKYCSYANRKFERGPLSCTILIDTFYENKDAAASNSLMQTVSKHINTPLYHDLGRVYVKEFTYTPDFEPQGFKQELGEKKEPYCLVGYFYPAKTAPYETFQSSFDENLKISMQCGGPAKAEHYPLRD